MNQHFFILTHEDANWKILSDGLARKLSFCIIQPPDRFEYESWDDLEYISQYYNQSASSFIHIITSKNNIIPSRFPGVKFLLYFGKSNEIDESKIDILHQRLRRLYEIRLKYPKILCINQEQLLSGNITKNIKNFFNHREYDIPGTHQEVSKGIEISNKTRKYLNYLAWCNKNLPNLHF